MSARTNTARYNRQMILPGLGTEGQQKLLDAKVLVIGAGGLGCPALQYLAAAGVGTIGIVDHDFVSLDNLHRQVLFSMNDIDLPKADIAALRLRALNPEIIIAPYQLELSTGNALTLIEDYDIILDGTDNFPSRYMINDACVLLDKPLVYAAVSQFEGQVAVFNVADTSGNKLNYRDMFPKPPGQDEVLNCVEAGVLGVLPGIIGTMQANEVIKLITGIGEALVNKVLVYNSLNNSTYELSLQKGADNSGTPQTKADFVKMDYTWFCGIFEDNPIEIDGDFFLQAMDDSSFTIIDVREHGELPYMDRFEHLEIPLSELKKKIPEIKTDKVIFFCQTGIRSLAAVRLADVVYGSKELYSLKGGLSGWL